METGAYEWLFPAPNKGDASRTLGALPASLTLLLGIDGLGRKKVGTKKHIDKHNGTLEKHIGNHWSIVTSFLLQAVDIEKLQGSTINISTKDGSLKIKYLYAESSYLSSAAGDILMGNVHGKFTKKFQSAIRATSI